MGDTLKGSCHCGAVRLEFPRPREDVNECQCSICRRYGALWSYYRPDEVKVTVRRGGGTASVDEASADTHEYSCHGAQIAFVRCARCGVLTHWAPQPGSRHDGRMMGVNCRILERDDLDRLPRRLSEGPE